MVTLTRSTTAADGVALVTARVEGAAVPRRVTLANRLDGPVWPPRREGVPEAGWDEDEYVGVVPADGRLVLGYASPAPPADPPLELVRSEPVAEGDVSTPDGIDGHAPGASDAATGCASADGRSAAAVRRLGDPRPPRDAVPLPAPAEPGAATEPEREDATSSAPTDPTPADAGDSTGPPSASTVPPELIRQWLDAVEDCVATAEHLADADDLPAATDAVAEAGGLAGAERISDEVERDATTLAALAERADALAERAEAADVLLATLRSLA